MLTEKDKQLIAKAETLSISQWDEAEELAKQAETDEARERLRLIASSLYHKEEYYAGLL